jgi:Flp pilus assembly pilin Flp
MLKQIKNHFGDLHKDEKGAGLVEYVALAALILLLAVVAMKKVGTTASTTLNKVEQQITAPVTAP